MKINVSRSKVFFIFRRSIQTEFFNSMSEKKAKGKLLLVPAPLEEENHARYLPAEITEAIQQCDVFIVEELKTARRFIKKMVKEKNIDASTFFELNEHTAPAEIKTMMQPLAEGKNIALVSEAGCPAVADPGQLAVAYAHANKFQVVPLVGPSSILLALMASGFNGQQFKFNGYLPKEQAARRQKIKELENEVKKSGTTQLFIETPYRNNHMLDDLLQNLHNETGLCIACEIKSPQEIITTKSVGDWKKNKPDLGKKNVVFVVGR